MNLKTWGPDTSVTDLTRDWLPCCGNAGLNANPLVADTACFDLLTFLDEDERGALGTAQDFQSNVQSEFASILSRRSVSCNSDFLSPLDSSRAQNQGQSHCCFQPGPRSSAGW